MSTELSISSFICYLAGDMNTTLDKSRKRRLLIVLFGVLIPAFMFQFIIRGKKAPEIPLHKTVLLDEQNKKVSVDDFKGKVLIVSYFQTWCIDCRKEEPELSQLQKAIGEDKLKVILISDEPFEKINQMRDYLKSDMAFYRSEKSLKEIGIKRYPTTYLLDKNRKLVEAKVEGIDWYNDEMVALINRLSE